MNITVICTGGTIDKDYSCALGGVNFEVGEPAGIVAWASCP